MLTFASSAHANIIVVNGINAKNAFLAQTKGRRERERVRKRKERERESQIGSEALAETEKNRKRPQPGIESGTWDTGPQQTRLILYH